MDLWQNPNGVLSPWLGEEHALEIPELKIPDLEGFESIYHLVDFATDKNETAVELRNDLRPSPAFQDPTHSDTAESCSSDASDHLELVDSGKDSLDDLWTSLVDLPPLDTETRFVSWDTFATEYKTTIRDATVPALYVSEAGEAAINEALDKAALSSNGKLIKGEAIKYDVLLSSLQHLAFGRPSVLFKFSSNGNDFVTSITNARASACTTECSQALFDFYCTLGKKILGLRAFHEDLCFDSTAPASLVAFASAVATILDHTEAKAIKSCGRLRSLLQLQGIFQPVDNLTTVLENIKDELKVLQTNETIVGSLFNTIECMSYSNGSSYATCVEVFRLTARPWLESLQSSLIKNHAGTSQIQAFTRGLSVQQEYEDYALTKRLKLNNHSLLRPELFQILHGSQESKSYLEKVAATDPLLNAIKASDSSQLEVAFQWIDLQRIEQKAADLYERISSMYELLCRESTRGTTQFDSGRGEEHAIETEILKPTETANLVLDFNQTVEKLGRPLDDEIVLYAERNHENHVPQTLENLHSAVSSHETSWLPLDIAISSALLPPLQVVHDLYNHAAVHRLLDETQPTPGLDKCLDALSAFSLMQNGLFVSRISKVLFSPDTVSTTQHRGRFQTSIQDLGLNAGTEQRREWPPASSEIRLALHDLLPSVWHEIDTRHSATDLALSFSVRSNLAEEEIQRILDPNSLYALDFLSLTFTVPDPLAPVFSSYILETYDHIFALQLRLLRVRASLEQASRLIIGRSTSTKPVSSSDPLMFRLRWEMTVFVDTLCTYISNEGIRPPWQTWRAQVQQARSEVDGILPSRTQRSNRATMCSLRHAHSAALSTMSRNLLLHGSQRPAMRALEEVLSAVLSLARAQTRASTHGMLDGEADGVPSLTDVASRFRAGVAVLLDELRALETPRSLDDSDKIATQSRNDVFDEDNDSDDDNGRDIEGSATDLREVIERLALAH